jgi:hypothetical protein
MGKPPQELYGIPISILQAICHISAKTATRWKDGSTCPPPAAIMLVKILTTGDLSCFSHWSGWMIRDDMLISPEGWEITVNDVLASPLLRAQLAAYQTELRNLKGQIDGLEEQPEPGEIPAIRA